jgi:hypothetical protein
VPQSSPFYHDTFFAKNADTGNGVSFAGSQSRPMIHVRKSLAKSLNSRNTV